MSTLAVVPRTQGGGGCGGACGSSCGAGLEKVYPTTAVRWGAMRNIGEFSYAPNTVFRCGAKVVIQSERGVEMGEQVSLSCTGCGKHVSREQIKTYIANSGAEFFRPGAGRILREATPEDLAENERLAALTRDDVDHCALLVAQLNLDMHVITSERLLDGERIIFYFRAEERIDFRQLVRELSEHHHARIELRQVQARDEARLVADYEVCGREVCCKNFLKKLRPVNMKMAKLQKSTLDPSKLSGRCGRLRCCLRYEHEGYEELDRKLARLGSRLQTEFGAGTVVNRQILTQLLVLRLDDGREMTIPAEEIQGPAGPPPPDLRDIVTAGSRGPRGSSPAAAPDQAGPSDQAGRPQEPAPSDRPREGGPRPDRRGPDARRPRRDESSRPPAPPAPGQEPDATTGAADADGIARPPTGADGQEPRQRRRRRRRGRRMGGPGAGGSGPGDSGPGPAGEGPPTESGPQPG